MTVEAASCRAVPGCTGTAPSGFDGLHRCGYQPRPMESLLVRVAAGDEQAMRACIDAYGALVWRLASQMLPDAAEAEDAVQDVFISIWENARRHDPSVGSELTFVAMIARRRLIDRGRRTGHRRRTQSGFRTEVETTGTAWEVPADETLPDTARAALQALESLPDSQRTAVTLAVRGGLTHEQISVQTGMPLGTVKTNIRRGLQRIRTLLGTGEPESQGGDQ